MKNCIDICGLSIANMFRIPLECGKFLCFLHTILMKFLGNNYKPLPLAGYQNHCGRSVDAVLESVPQEPKWPHLGADLSIWLFWIEEQDARQLCRAAKAVLDISDALRASRVAKTNRCNILRVTKMSRFIDWSTSIHEEEREESMQKREKSRCKLLHRFISGH